MPKKMRQAVTIAWVGLLTLLMTSFAPALLTTPTAVEASSHREAPLISQDPVADATDLYSFVSPDRTDTVTFVTNWIPLESPASGPNWYRFGDDVLYELHLDNVGDAQDHVSFQFRFNTTITNPKSFLLNTGPVTSINDPDYNLRQAMTVTRVDAPADGSCKDKPLSNCSTAKSTQLGSNIPVAPPNVGPASFPTYPLVAAQAIANLDNGIKVFAGPRADAFYADIASLFDLLTIRKLPGNAGGGVNNFASYNVHTISIQVPINLLTKNGTRPTDPKDGAAVIGSWITSSRQTTKIFNTGKASTNSGEWVQIQRLGMPLVNEVIVPLGLKDAFNGLKPWQDRTIPDVVNVVVDPEPARLLKAIYGLKVPPAPRQDIVTVFLTGVPGLNQPPNVIPSEQLRLNVAIPPTNKPKRLGVLANDIAGFPNGRRLTDDVIDVSLQVVAGVLVDGYNISPNNVLGDGVNRTYRKLSTTFPYQATPYSSFFYYPARATDGDNEGADSDAPSVTDFNVLALKDLNLTTGGQIAGRVGVGGNASFTSYDLSKGVIMAGDNVLVNGNLSLKGGQVKGNAVYGGTFTNSNANFSNGSPIQRANPLDLASLQSDANTASNNWADLPANGTTTVQYGGISLAGSNSERNVFKVKGSDLASSNNLQINAPANSTVIINVDGTSDQIKSIGIALSGGIDRQRIVFNFYEATSLNISGVSVEGTIFAPKANVNVSNGGIRGSVIASVLSGGGANFENYPFVGKLPL